MPDRASLEDTAPAAEGEEEAAQPETVTMLPDATGKPQQSHDEFAALAARLDAVEAMIARLVAHMHAPLSLSIGPSELAQIAGALKPVHEAQVLDVLQKHFHMSGLAAIG